MAPTHALFDVELRSMRRVRAERLGFADFLHMEAVTIIKERLEEVNKTFNATLVVSGQPKLWQKEFPNADVIPDQDALSPQGTYDLAIHGLCAHSANDPVGQFVQLRHALKPDGLMLAVMFGGQTLHELRASLAEAEAAVRGGLSPRVAPMGEIRDLGGLIGRAGLALPVADNIVLNVTYDTPFHLMRDLRAMAETNVMTAQERGFMRRDMLARAVEIYAKSYGLPDGRIKATFELVFLTGWAPSDTQQKPLQPGSAKTRLADALGTTERPAGQKPGQD